jgi:anthranilate phosphoribosyltransferase
VIVVHGEGGLDEVSVSGQTFVAEWDRGRFSRSTVSPGDFGIARVPLGELVCPTREDAVSTALAVLQGRPGPASDFVVLNAAFALKAAERTPTIEQGVELSRRLLAQGAVLKKLEQIRKVTARLS